MSYDKIYKDNIVSGASIRDGKGNRIDTMYLSKDEFNTFNPAKSDLSNLTEDGLKVIKDNSGSGLEVGDIGTALYIDETKGLRRYLNGQIIDINANTQAFLDRLLQIQATNPDNFTTEDNWQAEALLNIDGCVYKFVLNYAEDGETVISVRLPKYPDYVEVDAGNVAVKGNGMTLGFTDGINNFGSHSYNYNGGSFVQNCINLYGSNVGTSQSGTNVNNNKSYGITTDPTKSGIVGTLTQTKLKLRYFIQIATGSETENNIVNDIELNNPYSLFDYKYSPFELNNISWLKSNGQWNAKSVYPEAYDKLLRIYNGTETVEGLSVKLSTEDYTGYDFVLNTADETFRLPIDTIDHPINSTGTLPVKGNGMTLGLTNGTTNFGLGIYSGQNVGASTLNYNKPVGTDIGTGSNYTSASLGLVTDPTKSGIVADLTSKKANLYLYYYVGETVQNANLIDAGRIGEQLSGLVEVGGSLSMPSSKYIDLTLGANGSTYTAPANGWLYLNAKTTTTDGRFELHNITASDLAVKNKETIADRAVSAYIPLNRGDIGKVYYANITVSVFRFIYAQGDV